MIELPADDSSFTRLAMGQTGSAVIDAGYIATIGKVAKQWTGSEWIEVKPLPGQLKGPVAGDRGTDQYGGKTIYDGNQWLSVRDPNKPEANGDHFETADVDLCQLLNVAGDLVLGEGNMDTAVLFGRLLERVEGRLNAAN